MDTTLDLAQANAAQAAAGKYLTFLLGRESYGIEALKVREIIRLTAITTVPQMPPHLLGVINLRGKIIPVTDLKVRFGMPATEPTDRTCIIVVHTRSAAGATLPMGLQVDDVEEVVNIGQAEIEPTPDFGTQVDTHYLLGMAKVKGAVKALLDIDRVVAGEADLACGSGSNPSSAAAAPAELAASPPPEIVPV